MLVRDTDFVARYGGEEFFVILPNTNIKGAFILAERIRVAFANNIFKKEDISAIVTISIGISSTSDNNVMSDEDLIANADKSLYRAKWRGRDNVCTYEEAEVEETISIRDEVKKVDDFHNRLKSINENIKKTCIEYALNIFRDIESGWDYINEHSVRVSHYAEKLTEELMLSEEEKNIIRHAALLHDIGMVGISSEILRKKGNLTEEEYNIIKRHANIGVKILERTKLFDKELPIILYHHERFDGNGYPHKLKGESIPYGARILSIAEAYDVMMSDTDYRRAGSSEDAVEELKKYAGTQFDPHMVDTFIRVIDKNM